MLAEQTQEAEKILGALAEPPAQEQGERVSLPPSGLVERFRHREQLLTIFNQIRCRAKGARYVAV